MDHTRTIAALIAFLIAPCAFAQEAAEPTEPFSLGEGATSIEFRESAPAPFGEEDTSWWSAGVGVGLSDESTEINPYAMLHWFIADDFEFNLTFGGFYHNQDGDDAASGNFAIGWRWHFSNEPEQSWYLDIGIGLMGSSDEVPDGGTEFNFTPRAGIGTTLEIFEDSRARLDIGLRWYHFSNASISGSDDNPARDGVLLYVGVMVPF